MRIQTVTQTTYPKAILAIPKVFTALVSGTMLFAVLLGALVMAFEAYHDELVFPGVSVAGVDLSGLKPGEAAALLSTRLDYPQRGKILLKDGESIWLATPSQLGFTFDPISSVVAAYEVGRHGGILARLADQIQVWYRGVDLPPQYVLDEQVTFAFLDSIAAETDLPTIEASLSVDGADVVVRQGQVGRRLDTLGTLALLREQLPALKDAEVNLVIEEIPPAILDVDAQAEHARQILSAPLTLYVPEAGEDDPGPWTFEPEELARMLVIERVPSPEGDRYQVGFQSEPLRDFLQDVAPHLALTRENARFIFNDDTRQLEVIQPAVIGRQLAVDATIRAIDEKLLLGEHEIPLEIVYTPPEVGDQVTGEELGITELVSSHTSYFYGSSAERIHNIQVASARFHGLLVPPGVTFSMAEVLGNVTLDEGYAEALIIFGGRTIQGVGGGVCQVSTTLFRTVFFGGFPIIERHPHAYRVGYYEQTAGGQRNPNLAGLDASVFVPLVDFKFTNDTPHWILMETYVNASARTLTWKFYSTSDGRTVEWSTSGVKNKVPPPDPVYEENPALAKGEVKQVDWEAEGADVSVTRTVLRGGEVLYKDTINTHYLPWRAVYQYGPGTENMPPDEEDDEDE